MSVTNFKRLDSDDSGKAVPFEYVDVNTVTNTTYTIAATDIGDIIKFDNVSSIAVTLPTNAAVPIVVGTILTLVQWGVGTVSITPASGVTIYQEPGVEVTSPSMISTRAQYTKVQLTKVGDDEWLSDGYGIYVQETAPANPQVGDLWFW